MLPHLSDELMRATQRHGLDGRPIDRNAAHLLDLRKARREEALAAEGQTPARGRAAMTWFRWPKALVRALASLRPAG